MSTIYCREDCKCSVCHEGAWFARFSGMGEYGPIGYGPRCGTRLLPGGRTEAMVEERVALKALAIARAECYDCPAWEGCDYGPEKMTGDRRQCAGRLLAWAEREAKEKPAP